MNESLFVRKQVLNWECWLIILTLNVPLLDTVAQDIPKVYLVREVILGFFGRFPSLSLTWDGFSRFYDCPRLGGTGLFIFCFGSSSNLRRLNLSRTRAGGSVCHGD